MKKDDRIKLAKAMGWRENIPPEAVGWWTHDEKHLHRTHCPDPENDANDDYAVLEWAREQGVPFLSKMRYHLPNRFTDYKIGDNARAVLEVWKGIESEEDGGGG